jgi:hypothetical protein
MTDTMLERPPCLETPPLDSADVVEVPLLLSGQQMLALEEAAHDRGLTAGEMVRRLLQEFIARAIPCKIGPV